jgi:lipoprotein
MTIRREMNTFMKKIIILVIFAMTVFSCSLLDEVNREDAERGRTCYEDQYGNVRCENTR